MKIQGETVRYLSRGDARRYQSRLRALEQLKEVPAKLIGGTPEKPSLGVLLDCREVECLRKPKAKAVRQKRVAIDPSDEPF